MKQLIYAVLVMIFSINFGMAETPITPKINEGDRAILFSFSGLGVFGVGEIGVGRLEAVNKTLFGVGGLLYLNDDLGIRLGLNLWRTGVTTETTAGDRKESTTSIGFSPGVQYHIFTSGPVTVYTGGLLFFGRGSEKIDRPGGLPTIENSTNTIGFGGLLGFQYFLLQHLSFSAEYRLGFDRSSSKQKVGPDTTDGPTITNFGISAYSLTLAVFFN